MHKCFPIIAAFRVNYPESCNLTLVQTNQACPKCVATKEEFGSIRKNYEARTVNGMRALYLRANHMERQDREILLQKIGLVNEKVCTKLSLHYIIYDLLSTSLFSGRALHGLNCE